MQSVILQIIKYKFNKGNAYIKVEQRILNNQCGIEISYMYIYIIIHNIYDTSCFLS